jgi:hypothetical protein
VSATPSSALSSLLRRIANDAPAVPDVPGETLADDEVPEIFGFAEFEPEPDAAVLADPAEEDILALLAAQPEIAPLTEDDLSIVRAGAAMAPARKPEPVPETPPASAPEPAPPDAPSSPSRARTLVARFSRASAGTGAAWPGFLTQAPDEGERPPVSAPPREMPASSAAATGATTTDRNGHQPPSRNRRLYRRVPLGAEIEIDGVKCRVIDLSIGGFAASGRLDVAPNTVVPVTLRLTIDGIEIGTRLDARIVYSQRARSSGRFVEPTPSQVALLRYLVTWRGESVGTIGTTTLLDAITGGPDHGFAPGSAVAPRERWWSGMIGRKVKPPR